MVRARRFWTVAFLSVPLTVYIVIVIYPLIQSFIYGFTDWNGLNENYQFNGLDNFARMAKDPLFANAMKNTVIWTVAAVIIPTSLGLGIALALHGQSWLNRLYKSLFYLPICLSLAVVGQVWIWIYQPTWGLLNVTLRNLGLDYLARAWLAKPDSVLLSVIFAWAWQQTALSMVIFLAGLTSVPQELTEAAQIDGANYWQTVRRVIIPLLAPATIVVIALSIINSLKSFDVVYVMTRGGPFNSSDTLAMFIYNESFQKYYFGYGSAAAIVLFLITLVLITIYFRQVRNLERLYD